MVGNAAVCGQLALNDDERVLTHSPNSHYVPTAAGQVFTGYVSSAAVAAIRPSDARGKSRPEADS